MVNYKFQKNSLLKFYGYKWRKISNYENNILETKNLYVILINVKILKHTLVEIVGLVKKRLLKYYEQRIINANYWGLW